MSLELHSQNLPLNTSYEPPLTWENSTLVQITLEFGRLFTRISNSIGPCIEFTQAQETADASPLDKKTIESLLQLAKENRISKNLSMEKPHWTWKAEKRRFLNSSRASEEILFSAKFRALEKISNLPCSLEWHASDLTSLKKQLDETFEAWNSWLTPSVWPMPEGEIPLLWSNLAHAKLHLLILRSLEADSILKNPGFLLAPWNFSFEYSEKASLSSLIDAEGTPLQVGKITETGKMPRLACTQKQASRLGIAALGHARRSSRKNPPVCGFRKIVVENKNQTEKMSLNGIRIEDIQIKNFDPTTGHLDLVLSQAYLVHHGQKGEKLAPTLVKTSLTELLSKWVYFADTPQNHGFLLRKSKTTYLTEIVVPDAEMQGLHLPGTVPASNYW